MPLNIASCVPAVLLALPDSMKYAIDSTLSNAESSSDAELSVFLQDEIGLTAEQAQAAITQREHYFSNPFFQLFDVAPC